MPKLILHQSLRRLSRWAGGTILCLSAMPGASAQAQAIPMGSAPATSAGAAPCRALAADAQVRRALRGSHLAAARRSGNHAHIRGPLGRVYLGRCGTKMYAAATFSMPVVRTTDQPEMFVRRAHRAWRDLGDSGGVLCPKVPARL